MRSFSQISSRFGPLSFYREAITIALPVMLQQLIMSMVSLIDNFMVAGLGDISMAAVNVANNISSLGGEAFLCGTIGYDFFGKEIWHETRIPFQGDFFAACRELVFCFVQNYSPPHDSHDDHEQRRAGTDCRGGRGLSQAGVVDCFSDGSFNVDRHEFPGNCHAEMAAVCFGGGYSGQYRRKLDFDLRQSGRAPAGSVGSGLRDYCRPDF